MTSLNDVIFVVVPLIIDFFIFFENILTFVCRCLEYALNTSLIKSQDADSVIISVASNPNGRLLAWDFLRSHWSTLRKRYKLNS